MNNNNLKQEVTILKTWKGETFELDIKYEDYLIMETNIKANGGDGFDSSKYRRFIKFSAIEDKIGKTRYIALEAPEETKMDITPKERAKVLENVAKAMDITLEGRRKRFILRRKEILEQLRKEEVHFGLETTVSKLEEYKTLLLKEKLDND